KKTRVSSDQIISFFRFMRLFDVSLFSINGTLKKAASDPDGNMIDQDWMQSDRQLDVYSESSISEFDAFVLDINLEWVYMQQGAWSLFSGFGYLRQEFEYEGQLIGQSSPSGVYPEYTYQGDGSTGITYETTYSMVYFLLGADMQVTPQLNLSGKFSVAPLATADDELVHLYRNKVSSGDMDGSAYIFELTGNYHILPLWFVEVGAQFTTISADGDQQQILDGQALGRVDEETVSDQASLYITMGYSF
ncbi:MAG: omptin family outer membrane protease, partial [Candidatus Electrothrix sp. ATG2]|nr:omptin family outer membrane protease [Candidatus Electrothrix sp. ATG2]